MFRKTTTSYSSLGPLYKTQVRQVRVMEGGMTSSLGEVRLSDVSVRTVGFYSKLDVKFLFYGRP